MSRARYIVVLLTATLVSLAASGQASQAPANEQSNSATSAQDTRDRVATHLDRMARRLNLTEEQKAQITPILQDQVAQARAIRHDASLTPEQKRGKLRLLRDSSRAEVESVLTPEQVARMPRPGAARGMARIARRLDLSAEQKAKIRPLLVQQHKEVRAIREDSALSAQQKKERVREVRKSTHQQILALLTPQQQQELKDMRGRWHERRHGRNSNQAPETPSQPSTGQPTPTP